MMDRRIFVYGTLRHLPLLAQVMGCSASDLPIQRATCDDHRVARVQGHDFPMILPAAGETADGLLLQGLSAEQSQALQYYEGGFDYDLRPLPVNVEGDQVLADVFFPDPALWVPAEPWSLSNWVTRFGEFTLRLAYEKMRARPNMPADGRLPEYAATMMGMRAQSWVQAQAVPPVTGQDAGVVPHLNDRDVDVIEHRRCHTGFFAFDELVLRHALYDGGTSHPITRGYLVSTDAAVILLYDPQRDSVLLIQQFRAPVFGAGHRSPWIWEAVAGLVDPGETPQQAATREAVEEAGVTVTKIHSIGASWSSPGSSTERIHLFVGEADFSTRGTGGGLDTEGEDIITQEFSRNEILSWVDGAQYDNLPLLTCVLWLDRYLAGRSRS
jgi:nudix-type nucleoside diphosphatase (YffH/AdpP family)